jgi:hypothetical protein
LLSSQGPASEIQCHKCMATNLNWSTTVSQSILTCTSLMSHLAARSTLSVSLLIEISSWKT